MIGAQDDQIAHLLQPIAVDLRRRSLSADQSRRTTRRRSSAPTSIGQVHARASLLLAGVTAGRSEGAGREPRLRAARERRRRARRSVTSIPTRATYAQGRVVHRARLHDQDRDVLPFDTTSRSESSAATRTVSTSRDWWSSRPEPGRGGGARVPQRPHPLHLLDDGRRAAAERASRSAGAALIASLDAYNLFNQSNSVEEAQVTGAGPRVETAVQPPRVVRLAVKIPF